MRQRTPIRFFSLVIFTLTFTALAYAQGPQRTFVSAQNGNDANTVSNCSVTQPCRSFNAAIGVVRAGGEVVALDSGGYGQVTINKSVTLTAPTGVYVAVTAQAAASNAIEVNAAGGFQGGDTVVLRGLTLTGLGGQRTEKPDSATQDCALPPLGGWGAGPETGPAAHPPGDTVAPRWTAFNEKALTGDHLVT